jgi:CheY-like chemotaxis protein
VIAARATQDQETAKVPHVLIVEDDPDVLQMMEDVLRLEGYSTETARNGAEALERTRQRRPCLVLLDLMMPVMDGWTFRKRQLADPVISDVPVLCVTAAGRHMLLEDQLKAPCLSKPVNFDALIRALAEQCGPAVRES